MFSLGGVALGRVFYILCVAFGITALSLGMAHAYDLLRLTGLSHLAGMAGADAEWMLTVPSA
jgi:threonine/homoserine/homoserine lactone efflux protein